MSRALAGVTDGAARLTLVFALAMVIYIPLEPWVLERLPEEAYWLLRLAPDAAITLLTVAAIVLNANRRTTAWKVLVATVLVLVVLVALNFLRGDAISASVNALRVLIRYPLLGLVVWVWVRDADTFARHLTTAILAAGLIQAGASMLELVVGLTATGWPPDPLSGTTGRYDRLGLLLMAVSLLVVSRRRVSQSRLELLLLGAALFCLFFSTSRQAALGLAVGAGVLALLPRSPGGARLLAVGTAGFALAMVVLTPLLMPGSPVADAGEDIGGPAPSGIPSTQHTPAPGSPARPPVVRGSTQLSIDANKNFRLYLNFVIVPWAITQEPLLGLGPGAQNAATVDPRLVDRIEGDGVDWSFAQRFMNDSNYATLVIQFGLLAAALLMLLLVVPAVMSLRRTRQSPEPLHAFAVALVGAVLIAAAFGPALESRIISLMVWLTLYGSVALLRPAWSGAERQAQAGSMVPGGTTPERLGG